MSNEIDKKNEGDDPVHTLASNTRHFFLASWKALDTGFRASRDGKSGNRALPELTGKRWGDAAPALVTGLRPIRAVAERYGFDLEAFDGSGKIPPTPLHSYLHPQLLQLHQLKLAAVAPGAFGHSPHQTMLVLRNCVDAAIELCVSGLMEAQEQGLMLHRMIRA